MRSIRLITCLLFIIMIMTSCTKGNYHDLSEYGITPNNHENCSPLMAKALREIAQLPVKKGDTIRIILPKGRYDFYPDRAARCEYFISNHDQDNPKVVGLPFENMKNVIFDGQGSELIFHGRMLPVSLINSQNCQLKNFSIDFENPHISQIRVLNNDTIAQIITFEVAKWVKYEIHDSAFIAKGEGWSHIPKAGIAFENATKHLVYTTSDIPLGTKHVTEISPRVIKSFG
ncbi:MAG: alpha-1,3-galactosidase B, partial [Parabacteroides sp.]|nr:alpha-1,3-galactosidase B [Parabacteroides sp.]